MDLRGPAARLAEDELLEAGGTLRALHGWPVRRWRRRGRRHGGHVPTDSSDRRSDCESGLVE